MNAGDVAATDRSAIAIEGACLLIQDDKFQQILSLDRGAKQVAISALLRPIPEALAEMVEPTVNPKAYGGVVVASPFANLGPDLERLVSRLSRFL